jgi:hypothetical protein
MIRASGKKFRFPMINYARNQLPIGAFLFTNSVEKSVFYRHAL